MITFRHSFFLCTFFSVFSIKSMEIATAQELPSELYSKIINNILPGPDSENYFLEKEDRKNLSLVNKNFNNLVKTLGKECFYTPGNTHQKTALYYGLYEQMRLADECKNILSYSMIKENNATPEEIVAQLKERIAQDPLIVNYIWINRLDKTRNIFNQKPIISMLAYACLNFFNAPTPSKTNPVRLLLESNALPEQSIFEQENTEYEWLLDLSQNQNLSVDQKIKTKIMLNDYMQYIGKRTRNNMLSLQTAVVTGVALTPEKVASYSSRLALSFLSWTVNCKTLLFNNTDEINTYIQDTIDRGLPINQRDIFSRTALHWAALNNNHFIIPLISHKADINAVDMFGKKPLDYVQIDTH